MPNYRRAHIRGGTYFFTVNTLNRQTLLLDATVRDALRAGINRVRESYSFTIEAWVLLSDHLHCLWTLPPDDRDFSTRWRVIKRTVTQRCGDRLQRPEMMTTRRAQRKQSTLWQHRYWEHLIRDERDYQRHVDYIHWNPVKHGYVQRAGDWPYSTFQRYVEKGVYSPDWGLGDSVGEEGDFGETK
jgi:putative transposase